MKSLTYAILFLIVAGIGAFCCQANDNSQSSSEQSVLDEKAKDLEEGLRELAGPAAHTKLDLSKPLREQTRIVEMAGRRFEIPIMYFDTAVDPGEHQNALLLEVYWPDMKSKYEFKDRAEQKRAKMEERRVGWILLQLEKNRMPLEEQNRVGEESLTKFVSVGPVDGLHKGLWYRGLLETPELWAEVYVEKDANAKLVSFIRCLRGASAKFPRCSHHFVDGGIEYKISYNEANFLPQWREQRQRTIDFLRSFEIE